ncbi:MAG TPA: tetratricopeptide repeat protein [Myxococcaceae bacterium]|nr:tetratricopeptide repeat protein [Myxococcaceae bacterium]
MRRRLLPLAAAAAALWLTGCKETPADHFQKAKDAIYEKDPQSALKHYRAALDILEKDESPEAGLMRARALRGAADVYFLELRDMRQAVSVYRELINQCPESKEALEAHVILADILRNHFHDLRGAINELTAAIARNPPQSAELTYQVAKHYFELGDYQQCALEAQQVFTRYETSAFVDDAMFLRAQALSMLDDRKAEAAKAFEDLARSMPDSELAPHALDELAKLKADAGDDEGAIATWVEALKKHPNPSEVQASINRVRQRIARTTPTHVGDVGEAFDHIAGRRAAPPKTSIEAVGGTAEEATRDHE